MFDVRPRIKAQVKALIQQGVYTEWSDAADLLETHDRHRVAFEGEEDAPIVDDSDEDDSDDDVDAVDDAGDGGDDGDDGDGGGDRQVLPGLSTHGDDADFQGGGAVPPSGG